MLAGTPNRRVAVNSADPSMRGSAYAVNAASSANRYTTTAAGGSSSQRKSFWRSPACRSKRGTDSAAT